MAEPPPRDPANNHGPEQQPPVLIDLGVFAEQGRHLEEYVSLVQEIDVEIRTDIRKRLRELDKTFVPALRETSSSLGDLEEATSAYRWSVDKLVKHILGEPKYMQDLRDAISGMERGKLGQAYAAPDILLEYNHVLDTSIATCGDKLNAFTKSRDLAEEQLQRLTGLYGPLKKDLRELVFRMKDTASLAFTASCTVLVVGGGITAMLALACVGSAPIALPAAVVGALSNVVSVGATVSAANAVAAGGTLITALVSGSFWKGWYG
eukprot:scpid99611/ scgid23965/ 